jgi:hypothetical protein
MADKPTNLPALRDTDPKTILARYLSDESTKDIAADYGVTRQALGQYLMATVEDEWKQAQVARAQAKKESADDVYDKAQADLELACDRDARELSLARVKVAEAQRKAAQWDLERVCRRIYGQDVSPDQLGKISITLNIGADTGAHIVHEQPKDGE